MQSCCFANLNLLLFVVAVVVVVVVAVVVAYSCLRSLISNDQWNGEQWATTSVEQPLTSPAVSKEWIPAEKEL